MIPRGQWDITWKTVIAEVDAANETTATTIDQVVRDLGFRHHGDAGEASVYRRARLVALLPACYEWRVQVTPCGTGGSTFEVRIGLAGTLAYYAGMIAAYLLAMLSILALTLRPDLAAVVVPVAAVLFLLPVIQAVILRLSTGWLERRLRAGLAPLGPWRSSWTLLPTLNRAYGADRLIADKPGTRP